jgi:hypothetical protein
MPGDLTDDQIMEILKVAFRQQAVRETLEAMLSVVKEAKDDLEKMLEDPIE